LNLLVVEVVGEEVLVGGLVEVVMEEFLPLQHLVGG
jgi:hypothetical protein